MIGAGGRALPCALLIWLLGPIADARALDIEVQTSASGEQAVVIVSGEFEYGDEEQFKLKTSGLSKALVGLSSPGGNLHAGLEIGRQIRLKGFVTIVPDGVRCASACAFAWLGGLPRLMGANAFVGFHAASIVKDGAAEVSASGNALVGAYLNQIGLPDRAIIYITNPSPDDVAWLSFSDAEQLGIDVKRADPPKTGSDPQTARLDAGELSIADRLSANVAQRVQAVGVGGLGASISACYRQISANLSRDGIIYCVALDYCASQLNPDLRNSRRVVEFLSAIGIQTNAFDEVTAPAARIAGRVMTLIGRRP